MEDTENSECNNFSPCNLVTAYQQESLNKCQTCEYVSEFSPRFILSPEMPCPTFLSCQIPNDEIRWKCKSSKSCQFDCVDRKCIPTIGDTEYAGSDDVIYIRDVGCQFRSHNFYPKDSSRHSITSSTCFDLVSSNVGNYYSNNHTLRYEDKCTNPISGEELSLSTFTTSSIDSHCPSHGIQTRKKQTGFKSTASPIVTAFSTYQDSMLQYLPKSDEVSRATSKSDSIDTLRYLTTFPSQRSFLKGKNKNLLSIRRRNKSKRNNTTLNSRRINNVF
ncbi:jg22753 [Pararge aegeria aegeria]|uniref:Jg22753 protein n=1 Tax=Pararge aegeria aegeria TaxID=348720 RepID=A0A8S4RSE0_9NEOP|nr:jg22753 [Pararge aegeria aegeria]